MRRVVTQLNLQESLGGGEIYTRFTLMACEALGWGARLFVSPRATFWRSLLSSNTEIVPLDSYGALERSVGSNADILLTHTALDAHWAERIGQKTNLVGMLHMPLYERFPQGLRHYRRLIAVSKHVAKSARERGLQQVSDVELLGVADTLPRGPCMPIERNSPYDWDRRKVRDRVMGWCASVTPFRNGPRFERIDNSLTIGIVSRLTPIKQFPKLFETLAPVMARYPQVRLEIFGSGGYASVRDLRRALRPCSSQVRFWGQQADVISVYRQLDYVISGLPEKEALGLNLIEAQACGTPVLAVSAPPFIETVLDSQTGYLFDDPRSDGGDSFARLLERIMQLERRLDPRKAVEHLARFSEVAFRDRLRLAFHGL